MILIPLFLATSIPLWPNLTDASLEKDKTTEKDGLIAGRRVIRLGPVTAPDLTVYSPPMGKNTGTAVLVFPGGGYSILAMDLEGTEVCEWLRSIGITGVLVKYRVPGRENAFQDAQRAMGIVRHRAAEWGIRPDRIGVLGFSAGGHLAASLSTHYGKRAYQPIDAADQVSCRPDFALIIYPAYLTDLKIVDQPPPSFLAQTEDDTLVDSSLAYYAALKQAKVPAEMHLYPAGGHGYGLRRTEKRVTTWPDRAKEWLHDLGVL